MSIRTDTFGQASAAVNTFIEHATQGTGGPAAFVADSTAVNAQLDKMLDNDSLSKTQYDKMKGDVQSMLQSAGASDGAAIWNSAMDDLVQGLNAVTAVGNPNAATNPELDLGSPEGAAAIADLMDDKSDFSANNDVKAAAKKAGGSPAELAAQLKKDGMHLYMDKSGNAVLYSERSRHTQGFDPAGKRVDTGALDRKEINKQLGSIDGIKVGDLSLKFGTDKDSNGHVYGLDVKSQA